MLPLRAVRRTGITLGLLTCTVVTGAGPAMAAPTGITGARTQQMAAPTLQSHQFGWYPKGATLTLVCYRRGQSVPGVYSAYFANGRSDLWYLTTDGHFVADVDLWTNSNDPVTRECETPTGPGTAKPATEPS